MKRISFALFLVAVLSSSACFGVQVFDIDFGNVPQGQSKSKQFEFNANDIDATLAGDTPFEIQPPAPFKASPLTGTARRITKTTVTVTLPANAPIGVFDLQLKVILHKKPGDNPFINIRLRAAVVGFPFVLNPPDVLDLGTESQKPLLVKNNSVSKEKFAVDAQNFVATPLLVEVNGGGTAQVIISVPPSLTQDTTEPIAIVDQRSGLSKSIQVKAKPGTKPDLETTITAVKVFPRSTGATETTIQVTFAIKNVGFAATVPCQGKIFINNDKVVDLNLDAIAPAAQVQGLTETFKTTKTGNRTLKVKADTNDKNNEPNENNNNATKDIQIP